MHKYDIIAMRSVGLYSADGRFKIMFSGSGVISPLSVCGYINALTVCPCLWADFL